MENTFLLAGNGPYENHGCEAIVRGTVNILKEHFREPNIIVASYFNNDTQFYNQKDNEYDKKVFHVKHMKIKRYSTDWINSNLAGLINSQWKQNYKFKNLNEDINESKAVLSIGGDNYSLDYGIPTIFTDLDNYALYNKKPIIIWGASVGPFSSDKNYEKFMKDHLKKVTGIFAREPRTIEYLDSIGIRDNVYRVCDPAFHLLPEEVEGLEIRKNSIGINISPIMEKYVGDKDTKNFVDLCVRVIEKLIKDTGKNIYLIPHVVIHGNSDYDLMKQVLHKIDEDFKSKVVLIDNKYNAGQYKSIISKMDVFFGARTHATIAAFSSSVPTLSFVYSIKSIGINKDFFGSDKYCIYPEDFIKEVFIEKMKDVIKNKEAIHKEISNKVIIMKKMSLDAGKYLKDIVGN